MPYKNIEDKYANQEEHRQENRRRFAEYMKDKFCVDCGEDDNRCLEHDHVSGEKKFEIGRAIGGSTRSWKAIMKEALKCEVRCANCHRKKTGAERGYWNKI